MMGKTHLTVGIAAALAVTHPTDMRGILAAVLGGAAGAIVCDLDTIRIPQKNGRRSGGFKMTDENVTRIIFCFIAAVVIAADAYFRTGIVKEAVNLGKRNLMLCIGAFALMCLGGTVSQPKTFAHSILFILELCLVIYFASRPMLIPFAVGGTTHLILDIVNKRPIQLLYPFRRRFCLNLCRPDKTANLICMLIGLAADIGLLGFYYMKIR